jgi:hypothetical protein
VGRSKQSLRKKSGGTEGGAECLRPTCAAGGTALIMGNYFDTQIAACPVAIENIGGSNPNGKLLIIIL